NKKFLSLALFHLNLFVLSQHNSIQVNPEKEVILLKKSACRKYSFEILRTGLRVAEDHLTPDIYHLEEN
ncbi:hypothetical protein, partial [Enterococcus gallinarum]|uniref:hypothetical protein n=1 Tax=Enterococcus gallinarum TaxID=1353 RepID=UPI0027E09DFD